MIARPPSPQKGIESNIPRFRYRLTLPRLHQKHERASRFRSEGLVDESEKYRFSRELELFNFVITTFGHILVIKKLFEKLSSINGGSHCIPNDYVEHKLSL
jgi:hypothetical protein